MANTKLGVVAVLLISLVGMSAWGGTYRRESYTCPIDGTEFESRSAASGFQRTMRLDLKRVGAIAAPWPIPVCPTDHFVVLDFDAEELEQLRQFVPSEEYQAFASANPAAYARLARLFEFLGRDRSAIGNAFLKASWEVEHNEALRDQYLALSLKHNLAALPTDGPLSDDSVNLAVLCGELERRLGQFERARERFTRLLDSPELLNDLLTRIAQYQLELIAQRDNDPHEIPE